MAKMEQQRNIAGQKGGVCYAIQLRIILTWAFLLDYSQM